MTCGECQKEFLLCDIVEFLQHKVNRCNKENEKPEKESSCEVSDTELSEQDMSRSDESVQLSFSSSSKSLHGTSKTKSHGEDQSDNNLEVDSPSTVHSEIPSLTGMSVSAFSLCCKMIFVFHCSEV